MRLILMYAAAARLNIEMHPPGVPDNEVYL